MDTEERKESVWSARGAFLEAIKASTTETDECDVVVPGNQVDTFIKFTHELAEKFQIRIPNFGHAGDGNLHVYICRDALSNVQWEQTLRACFERMYEKAEEAGPPFCDAQMLTSVACALQNKEYNILWT